MRLIDADAFKEYIIEACEDLAPLFNDNGKVAKMVTESFCKDIDDQPTISAEPQWIPVSEKLPDVNGDYLLYRPHFWGAYEGQVTVCYWNGHDWSDNYRNDAERYLPVISGMAWMPLPKPYERRTDED